VAKRIVNLLLPLCGVALAIGIWWAASRMVPDLPSPVRTWEESKLYILEPLTKRGETDQGILLLAYYSLVRVAQGFFLGIAIATPIGFLLGVSPLLRDLILCQKACPRARPSWAWLQLRHQAQRTSKGPTRRSPTSAPGRWCGCAWPITP
jgi:ABC-type nitrate/sulfonate/bicarbonate transport system permease component